MRLNVPLSPNSPTNQANISMSLKEAQLLKQALTHLMRSNETWSILTSGEIDLLRSLKQELDPLP